MVNFTYNYPTYNFLIDFFASSKFTDSKTLYSTDNSEITLLDNKIILKKTLHENSYMREKNILNKLKHTNIIKLVDTWLDIHKDKTVYNILLPYYKDGDLFNYIYRRRDLSLLSIKLIFYKLLIPVKYCHDLYIVHLDIKLENFMVVLNNNDEITDIQLIDFGMAHQLNADKDYILSQKLYFGTLKYINPEQSMKIYGKFSDIWCMGIILYIILFHKYPLPDFKENRDYKELDSNNFIYLEKILKKNYKERPSIDMLINDIWFSN